MREFFLTSERLMFSVWKEEDLPDALELWGSPEVTQYIVSGGSMSEEQIRQRLKNEIEMQKKYNVQYWPVYIKEDSEFAGCCGLRIKDLENGVLELGIHLKKRYWGKGIASEACRAVMEYAFGILDADALFAGHNPQNAASARILKRLGFRYIKDEYYPPTGLYHPSYLMSRKEFADIYKDMQV